MGPRFLPPCRTLPLLLAGVLLVGATAHAPVAASGGRIEPDRAMNEPSPPAIPAAASGAAPAGRTAGPGSSATSRNRARVDPALRERIAVEGDADAIVLLKSSPRGDRSAQRAEAARAQDEVLRSFHPGELRGLHRFAMLPAFAARITAEQLARLEANPRVLRVGGNEPGSGGLSQSVALIGGDIAHAAGRRGAGVTVAVLDTGIDRDHPDIGAALTAEHCFCQGAVLGDGVGCCPNGLEEQAGAGSAEDDHGHGSNVCGIILGRGEAALASVGMAPAASVVAVKVLGSGNTGFLLDWSKALDWVLANHPEVRLLNMSLQSGATYAAHCDALSAINTAMGATVDSLRALNDATTFSISGNYAMTGVTTSPGCLTNAVQVAAVYDQAFGSSAFGTTCTDATTAPDTITCFSNMDDTVDLLAPGCRIVGPNAATPAFPTFYYASYCGTSQSAPHAVGAAALLLESEPALTPAALVARLQTTGVPIFDARTGLTFARVSVPGAIPDLDGDGVPNTTDNCVETPNAAQDESDGDGPGDACDNCPAAANASQVDFDHDGLGDVCDGDPHSFPPETLFVVDAAAGGTIYQLDRGTRSVVNSFPTPEPAVGGGSGLAYSHHRGSLFYTNGTTAGVPTIWELHPVTGAVIGSFPQTNVDGLDGMTGLGASAGGLVTLAVDPPATPEFTSAPYDGSAYINGLLVGGTFTGQGAAGGNEYPPGPADHAGWLSRASTSGMTAPVIEQNQIFLFDISQGNLMERFRTPTRCVAPGPNGILETAPAAGDIVIGNEIQIGTNSACDTLAALGDDVAGCIDAGPNGVLGTAPAGDDLIAGRVITPGANAACNTTTPAGDDVAGGILGRRVNGLDANGGTLFASINDPAHDALYVLDAFSPTTVVPSPGPNVREVWPDPTPGGLIEAVAAGPADADFDRVLNGADNCRSAANPGQADGDADGAGDACDVCPAIPDPVQADGDADGDGDACDNCPAAANPLQEDGDGDTFGDVCDCVAGDGTVWSVPDEVTDVEADHDVLTGTTSLTWLAPAEPGGLPISYRYDVVRTGDPADFVTAAVCLESDDAADAAATDVAVPADGTAFFYWIRIENTCGAAGTRAGRACP